MAGRKAQHDAEYFPFFAKDGRTLFMLQTKFELEGIGFFTNLLRLLCTTPHHYLDLKDPMEALYTWSKIGLKDEVKAEAMLALMVNTGKIDRDLWEKRRVVFSQDFVDSLAELYAKRKEKPLTLSDIRGIYSISAPEMPIPAPEMPPSPDEPPISGGNNTQRRGEESKGKKNLRVPENPAPEKTTPSEPHDTTELVVPPNLKLSTKDLSELQARFGTRSQEALDKIAAIYAAKDYGYKNHWAGVKLWLADHASAAAWLDKATGKASTVPQAKPADTRGFNAEPVPEHERVQLGNLDGKAFVLGAVAEKRQSQKAPAVEFDPARHGEFDPGAIETG